MELSPELKSIQLDILNKLGKVEAGLLQNDPLLPMHLKEIHKALLENEELAHILPDDQIRIYLSGMTKYKNIKLIEEAKTKRSKSKITADDL